MQVYLVGGAVRDALLGRPVQDRDWVVVGASPEDMLADGFKPVGKDFPVFLHPRSGEEYALARTERKTGRGYGGFSFHTSAEVTLEQDLLRRDLTINAIAQSEDGQLVDPYGGIADLHAGVLRHVGPAFVEDPLRVLRVARFAARFASFRIAPETMQLMSDLVRSGELDELAAERCWQELARGLMEDSPWRLLDTLAACGALAAMMPAIAVTYEETVDQVKRSLMCCVERKLPLAVRWSCLIRHTLCAASKPAQAAHDCASAARTLSEQLKTPNDCRDLAELFARNHALLEERVTDADSTVSVLERCDAFRRPERFARLLDCAQCSHSTTAQTDHAQTGWLTALRTTQDIDAAAIAREAPNRADIPQLIRQARISALHADAPD